MSTLKITRRKFVKSAGLTAAAAILPFEKYFPKNIYVPKIGLQLYTIRKEIEIAFEDSMKKVADTGYAGIETYALPENLTLEHAAEVFKTLGLKVFSMHTDLPEGKQLEESLLAADIYDCNTVVYHGWPEGNKYKDKDALKYSAEVYNRIGDVLKVKGLRFGLHNHWWEFEKNVDGIYPFYFLLNNLNDDIIFEIDTYWAKTAGIDPAKIVKDFGKRAPLLHIKDGPAIKGKKSYEQVPAGSGVMDFQSIVKAAGENTEWMIVEFDEYNRNIFEGIRMSYKYLTVNKFAEGNV